MDDNIYKAMYGECMRLRDKYGPYYAALVVNILNYKVELMKEMQEDGEDTIDLDTERMDRLIDKVRDNALELGFTEDDSIIQASLDAEKVLNIYFSCVEERNERAKEMADSIIAQAMRR